MSRIHELRKVALLAIVLTGAVAGQEPANPPPAAAPPAATPTAAAPSPVHRELWSVKSPLGLEDVGLTAPDDNPITKPKVALGKKLFWDKRLSPQNTHACETCHDPEKGWTDGTQFSVKADGAINTRHSPTLYNVAYNKFFYWDGRAPSLEKQILAAWEGQMGAKGKTSELAKKINDVPGYKKLFGEAFQGDANPDRVVAAIASFTRTIMSGNSHYDAYASGKQDAISDAAKRGFNLFRTKARCATCHPPGLFTDQGFHNIGVGGGTPKEDPGYGKVANHPSYNGAFKTPTLRNVLSHPPFGHTGQFRNLMDFLKYAELPFDSPNMDPIFKGGIKLTEPEKSDLREFIRSLDSADDAETSSKPELP
ncbi:MAG: cytochrome-c peroxidase [Candidatus Wallbacteria bacterium]|nr:cytochrome-c peroxidase [Candidatus Wallbacteria bacterium]